MLERIILHSFHKYQLPVVPKEDTSQKNTERMNKKEPKNELKVFGFDTVVFFNVGLICYFSHYEHTLI